MFTSTTRKSLTALAAGASLALTLGACGTAENESTTAPTSGETTAASTGTETDGTLADDDAAPSDGGGEAAASSDSQGAEISVAKDAIELAVEQVTGTGVKSVDFDDDQTWDIEVLTANGVQDVEVSADGSSVLKTDEVESVDASDRQQVEGSITIEEAIDAAIEKVPGTFDEAELDDKDGTVVWEVSLYNNDGNKETVIVDAKTGDVK